MFRILIFLLFQMTLFGGSWKPTPLKDKVSQAHLVISGKVVELSSDFEETEIVKGKERLVSYRLAYVKVDEVLKYDLMGRNIEAGDTVAIRVSSTKNRISTAFAFEEGESGIWLLLMGREHFSAPNPLYFVKADKNSEIKEYLKNLKQEFELAIEEYIIDYEEKLEEIYSVGSPNKKQIEEALSRKVPPETDLKDLFAYSHYNLTSPNKSLLINSKGELIGSLPFHSFGLSSEGYFKTSIEAESGSLSKWTFADINGVPISDKRYDNIGPFSDGLAYVTKNGLTGYINTKGEEVIPLEYTQSYGFSGGIAYAIKNDKAVLLNTIGENILKPYIIPQHIGFLSEGLLSVNDGGRYRGYIDNSGDIALDLRKAYKESHFFAGNSFHDGMSKVSKYNRQSQSEYYGFINRKGELAVPIKYAYVYDFSEGLAAFKKSHEGMLGFLNKKGEEVIPLIYTGTSHFVKGLAAVTRSTWSKRYPIENPEYTFKDDALRYELREKWGMINKDGETVVPFLFSSIAPFQNGLARVSLYKPNEYNAYLMNEEGKVIFKLESRSYDSAVYIPHSNAPKLFWLFIAGVSILAAILFKNPLKSKLLK